MELDTGEGEARAHVAPVRLYLGVFGALLALTLATVAVSYVHLGAFNLAIAAVIATAKASLVVLYFMHLKWDVRFHAVVLLGALLLLGFFLAYTLNDTTYRSEIQPEAGARYDPRTGEWAAGLPEGAGRRVSPVSR